MSDLHLGVDLGTGKVAMVLCDGRGGGVHHESRPHHADRPGPEGAAEQDAQAILDTAFSMIGEMPPDHRDRIASVAVTGQMHGVVQHGTDARPRSPLVTWQDSRADPLPCGGRLVPSGHGLAILAWWARNKRLVAPRVATIHGLLTARLCGLDRAPIDPTDVSAWGGLTPPSGVPADILPRRVGHGALVGHTRGVPGLRDGLPVAAPLGDNQASVRGTLDDPATDLSLTIGTGCQLSMLIPGGDHPTPMPVPPPAQIRPFDEQFQLLVAAPKNGGSVWRWLAGTVQTWCADLGLQPPPTDRVYEFLDRLGLDAPDTLAFLPHLDGEIDAPDARASLSGFRRDSGRLGEIARAVARGLIQNIRRMIPDEALEGKRRLVGSGNALRRSALLRQQAERVLGLPLRLSAFPEEAALGAARVARALKRSNA